MTEKSHVALGQGQCFICAKFYETGEVLLHKRLKPVFDREVTTTNAPCPECKGRIDTNFTALIEADEDGDNRTGRIAWIPGDRWSEFFNVPRPPKGIGYIQKGILPQETPK